MPKAVSSGVNQRTLVMVVLVLVAVNSMIILCYRAYLQREMDRDMKI